MCVWINIAPQNVVSEEVTDLRANCDRDCEFDIMA
jgi:hypothetical protein